MINSSSKCGCVCAVFVKKEKWLVGGLVVLDGQMLNLHSVCCNYDVRHNIYFFWICIYLLLFLNKMITGNVVVVSLNSFHTPGTLVWMRMWLYFTFTTNRKKHQCRMSGITTIHLFQWHSENLDDLVLQQKLTFTNPLTVLVNTFQFRSIKTPN